MAMRKKPPDLSNLGKGKGNPVKERKGNAVREFKARLFDDGNSDKISYFRRIAKKETGMWWLDKLGGNSRALSGCTLTKKVAHFRQHLDNISTQFR